MMFAMDQSPMEENMMLVPPRMGFQPVWLYTDGAPNQLIFLAMNELKDEMKWMNENLYELTWRGKIEM